MANVNVRFYRLETLPSFEARHKGIFVHVTSNLIRTGIEGNYTYSWGKLDSKVIPNIVIQQIGERTVLVPEWMKLRRLDTVASGLWFGGENGWELLSNDTTSGAIDAAINDKIAALDVPGYAQATITPDTPAEGVSNSSTLTIKGIQEVDGKIGIPADSENLDLDIAIDGVYNESTNKIATQSTVTTEINGLNANTVQAVTKTTSGNNTTLTFKGVKETNGVIAQGDGATTFIVGDAKLNIQIGSEESGAFEVFSANKQSDSTIKLDGYVFKKDENNVISVIAETPVSQSNKLVTKADINGLAGAMHYRGGVTSLPLANENTKQGDVWIVTTAFGEYEVGDMFIARADGGSATFDTVQGNLTLGTGIGKVAANSAALSENKLVVASATGIETIDFDKDNLISGDNNKRTLSIGDGEADTTGVCHDVTITDALTVIGKPFTKSINITSTNRSIEIKKKTVDGVDTGVMVDLVWNTSIE